MMRAKQDQNPAKSHIEERPASPASMQGAIPILSVDDIEARPPPTNAQIKDVRDLAADLWKKRKRLAEIVKEGEDVSTAIALLEEKTIPDAMRKIGMTLFALTGGFRVTLVKSVVGGISKANMAAAHAWLEEHGYGAIIKHVLTISFGRDEDKWAKKFMADLAKRKRPIPVDRKDAVHAQTLGAFIRERIEAEKAGTTAPENNLPRDLFGVYEFEKAALVEPLAVNKKAAAKIEA